MTENKNKSAGGIARAKKLSPEKRKEISQKAINTRWGMPIATHGQDDHPLQIADIKIPCFVLDDGRRVLTQKEMSEAIGVYTTSWSPITKFAKGRVLQDSLSEETLHKLNNPIEFKTANGRKANGYEAEVLVDICDAVLDARKHDKLLPNQEKIAVQCEILVRGFARVGIIALIDEVTGYQEYRTKDALSQIFKEFIAKELQPYVSTFSIDFYKELFRLRGLPFDSSNVKRPQYFGTLTNDIIYKRLAPGILEELKKMVSISKKGNKSAKFFQHLTTNKGYPKLKEHLGSVVTLMKLSKTKDEFKELLDKIHPKYPANIIENEQELDIKDI